MEFVTRDLIEEDKPFVYNSHLKSLRRGAPMCWVPHTLYFKPQSEVLTYLLRSARTLVACFPEDPSSILGYVIWQDTPNALVLHYIYSRLRRGGVARQLLQSIAGEHRLVIATHMCDHYLTLRSKCLPLRVVYDPYLLPRMMAHGQAA